MTAACVLVVSTGVNSGFITMWKHSLISSEPSSPFTGGGRSWLEREAAGGVISRAPHQTGDAHS